MVGRLLSVGYHIFRCELLVPGRVNLQFVSQNIETKGECISIGLMSRRDTQKDGLAHVAPFIIWPCLISMWWVPKIGVPPKWMVKIMDNLIKMDDLGVPLFFGNTHVQFQGINKNFDLGGLFPPPRDAGGNGKGLGRHFPLPKNGGKSSLWSLASWKGTTPNLDLLQVL